MKFLQILTTIVGILMSIGYFPQVYKIVKTKSAENVSMITFSIFAIGTLIWTIYGIVLKDIVLISSFAIGVVGSWSVLFLSIYYTKIKK